MYPLLQDGDGVFFKLVSFSKIQVNDLLLIEQQKLLFVHRVVHKTKKYLVTKGDNNLKSDGKIYPKQIIAKAIRIKRGEQEHDLGDLYLIQSTLYLKEISKLKQVYDKAKLNYVFLKGLPLHLFFEGAYPKRIYFDCDILIDKKQIGTAFQLLKKQGYTEFNKQLFKTQVRLKDKEIEFVFLRVIGQFPVMFDLHLEPVFLMTELGELNELYPQKLLDQLTKDFLHTKRTISVQGGSYEILKTEYLILYLTLHFFHHNYRGAFRLDFIDKIIKKSKLTSKQWKQLEMKIYEYHFQNYVYASFYLLKKLYKTPIPASFLKSIKPSIFHLRCLSSILDYPLSIFDNQSRIRAGIERFRLIFVLSPNPWYRKLLVFTKPIVIYTVIWVFLRKIKKMISV